MAGERARPSIIEDVKTNQGRKGGGAPARRRTRKRAAGWGQTNLVRVSGGKVLIYYVDIPRAKPGGVIVARQRTK
jgi:hypothetical protein